MCLWLVCFNGRFAIDGDNTWMPIKRVMGHGGCLGGSYSWMIYTCMIYFSIYFLFFSTFSLKTLLMTFSDFEEFELFLEQEFLLEFEDD